MIGLLGKKVGMTQIFDEQGRRVPVTLLEIAPCWVTAVHDQKKNGYQAVQLAFDSVKEKRVNKAKLGTFKKIRVPASRFVREIRTQEVEGLQTGQQLKVDNFEAGDFVDIEGTSIGKGFQGVVKRHHFKGALTMSHGDMQGRRPGSIGASSFPSRVVKGMRMGGHMGHERITVQNLKVVKVDQENNLLMVKGAVPGVEGGYLVIRTALKKGPKRKWKVQASGASSSATDRTDPSLGGKETSSEQETKPAETAP